MMRIKHPARNGIWGIRLIGAGLAVALLALPAVADQQINETVKAKADGVVTVENIAGSIEVVGWDRNEVKVEGTLFGDVEKVEIDGGKKVRIEVKYPRHAKRTEGSAELVIHVPAASRVDVECISADVDVHDVTGIIDAESISGNVEVRGKCREVEAETISGSVTVDVDAAEVDVASISGNIKASGRDSDVEAESVSGNIWLEYEQFLSLEVESVSGDATVVGDLKAGGDFSFELHSGTLKLTVPGDVSADFRIETFSGGIDNGFGQKARKTSKYAPGRELEFTNGNGEARVNIDTFSGDVLIRKK
jgi:DUF4097 and DUF4098 domain-containing protein YvlB